LYYFSDNELLTIYSPHHHFKDSSFKKLNVVVLILESFSKEYTCLGRINSITPFLDSLMGYSMVFKNGFSNGTKSIEGIPAILSSLPSLLKNPVINSIYAANIQTSFASLLKPEGYTTAFFHGGINGTMNFNDWAKAAEYEYYFGKNEYADDKDFDGFWGIFDEPFLQYSVKKMNTFKQPFHSAVFTLSSHHPYLITDKYKNRFPKTKLENSESIGYADYSLKLFFEAAKKTNWYSNTLFVLTADHTSLSEHPFFTNPVGYFTIPILFFKPDNSLTGSTEKEFSQIDILPSTMHLLGYNKPFFAFGQSYLTKQQNNACVHINGTHYLYEDSMAYNFIGDKLDLVYNYKRDSTLNVNLLNRWPVADSTHLVKFKAFIQTYNTTLIENKGYYK
jgi:phosphoglycerol transferase MdoB-like AlkP superfamily enzyme